MSENEIIGYFGKDIRATLFDGQVFKGHVSSFTWANDSDDGEASITIDNNFNKDNLIDLTQSEIKSIEIINR